MTDEPVNTAYDNIVSADDGPLATVNMRRRAAARDLVSAITHSRVEKIVDLSLRQKTTFGTIIYDPGAELICRMQLARHARDHRAMVLHIMAEVLRFEAKPEAKDATEALITTICDEVEHHLGISTPLHADPEDEEAEAAAIVSDYKVAYTEADITAPPTSPTTAPPAPGPTETTPPSPPDNAGAPTPKPGTRTES